MEERPGAAEYVTATKAVNHGDPCIELGYVGFAQKQSTPPAGTGLGATAITQIAISEKFVIRTKGRHYTSSARQEGGTFSKGDPVYIISATNLLTATSNSGANPKFGRVAEVAPERGVGTGKMRVDLDAKDSF